MKKQKVSIALSLILAICLIIPNYAYASALYYVVAHNDSTAGKNAYGTYGYSVVHNKASEIDTLKVAAIYVIEAGFGDNYAEVGWCWHKGDSKPQVFRAFKMSGMWGQDKKHYGNIEPGSTHTFSVRHVTGTDLWYFYMDGNLLNSQKMLGYTKGWSTSASERNSRTETNAAHFYLLSNRDSVGNWSGWTNLQVLSNGSKYGDNDPDWKLSKISNREWKCIKG